MVGTDAGISDAFGSSTLKAFRPVHSSKLHYLFLRLSLVPADGRCPPSNQPKAFRERHDLLPDMSPVVAPVGSFASTLKPRMSLAGMNNHAGLNTARIGARSAVRRASRSACSS